jgi:hypothetical protein
MPRRKPKVKAVRNELREDERGPAKGVRVSQVRNQLRRLRRRSPR